MISNMSEESGEINHVLQRLPPEIFIFHVFPFVNEESLRKLLIICNWVRHLVLEFNEHFSFTESIRKLKLQPRTDRFNEKMGRWTQKRVLLDDNERDELDSRFIDCLRRIHDFTSLEPEIVQEASDIYEKGGGVSDPESLAIESKRRLPDTFVALLVRILEHEHIYDYELVLRYVRIQLDGGVPHSHEIKVQNRYVYGRSFYFLPHEEYYANISDFFPGFYVNFLLARSFDLDPNPNFLNRTKRKEELIHEKKIRLMFKILEYCRDSGMKHFFEISYLHPFIERMSSIIRQLKRTYPSTDKEERSYFLKWLEEYVRFFVSNGCDVLSTYVIDTKNRWYPEDGEPKKCNRHVNIIWRAFQLDLSSIIPLMFFPMRMSKLEKQNFIDSSKLHFSTRLNRDYNRRFNVSTTNKQTRKMFQKMIRFDWIRKGLSFLLFDLVKSRDRKMIQKWIHYSSKEEIRDVSKLKNDDGLNLLQFCDVVRGKVERLKYVLSQTVFCVENVTNT